MIIKLPLTSKKELESIVSDTNETIGKINKLIHTADMHEKNLAITESLQETLKAIQQDIWTLDGQKRQHEYIIYCSINQLNSAHVFAFQTKSYLKKQIRKQKTEIRNIREERKLKVQQYVQSEEMYRDVQKKIAEFDSLALQEEYENLVVNELNPNIGHINAKANVHIPRLDQKFNLDKLPRQLKTIGFESPMAQILTEENEAE